MCLHASPVILQISMPYLAKISRCARVKQWLAESHETLKDRLNACQKVHGSQNKLFHTSLAREPVVTSSSTFNAKFSPKGVYSTLLFKGRLPSVRQAAPSHANMAASGINRAIYQYGSRSAIFRKASVAAEPSRLMLIGGLSVGSCHWL